MAQKLRQFLRLIEVCTYQFLLKWKYNRKLFYLKKVCSYRLTTHDVLNLYTLSSWDLSHVDEIIWA